MRRTPLISVLMPVRNESATIRRTLESLRAQRMAVDQFEVLLADGDSTDGTAAIVRDVQSSFPQLKLFSNPDRWSSAGRNIGIRHARGEYLVVVDGHCEIEDRNYLKKVVEAFESTGADALGRPQPLRCSKPTRFQQAVALARGSWLGHNPDSAAFSNRPAFLPAENVAVAYRRQVFDDIGLFDESFDVCEDVELNRRFDRAGLKCFFCPEIGIAYHPRGTLRSVFHQMYRYGVGRARLAIKDPSSLTWAGLGPPLLVLLFGLMAIGTMVSRAFAWPAVELAFAYVTTAILECLRAGWRKPQACIWMPTTFAAIHAGFGIGFLKEAILGGCLRLFRFHSITRRALPNETALNAAKASGAA